MKPKRKSPTRLTPDLAERMRALRAAGRTYREIAAIIGCAKDTVQRVFDLIRAGHDFSGRDRKELAQQVQAAYAANDVAHLRALQHANGYGYSWLPLVIAERFYALEHAPESRDWWRACA